MINNCLHCNQEFTIDKRNYEIHKFCCKDCGKKHWRRSNSERYKATTHVYNQKRRADPEFRKKESERATAYYQTPKGRFNMYRSGARERNLEFNLTFDQFLMFWNSQCDYCGLEIEGVGIDRTDNSLGYSVENCVSCCPTCNNMKKALPQNEFIKQCERITLLRLKKYVVKNDCKQSTSGA